MERPFRGFSVLRYSKTVLNWMPALTTAVITTLFGQIYFRPFYNDFRFSLGVVVFAILLLMYERDWKNVFFTGLAVGLFRIALAIQVGISVEASLLNHFPSAGYYWLYGVLFYMFNIKSKLEKPLLSGFLLVGIDVLSNVLELALRQEYNRLTLMVKLESILAYGTFRAIMVLILYFVIRFYPELIYQQRQKRQSYQMLIDHSRLSNEVIFLKKSEDEIEHSMSEAFDLYTFLKNQNSFEWPSVDISESLPDQSEIEMNKKKALNLSRRIHDVKKDYKRIRAGLESMIPMVEALEGYEIRELVEVLCEDLTGMAKKQNKLIDFEVRGQMALSSKAIYPMIGIIGNLVVNSIEAFNKRGQISIELSKIKDQVVINVSDNGPGIDSENLPLLFEPGYSTKYDSETGKMSTGMGLSQVEYLTDQILMGKVTVNTQLGKGTCFTISFIDTYDEGFGG